MTRPTPCQQCKADLVRARGRIEELECEVEQAIDGGYCAVHDGRVHGGEAEELRHGLEQLITNDSVTPRQAQALLDRVDARDSLAHGELTEKLSAAQARVKELEADSEKAILLLLRCKHGFDWNQYDSPEQNKIGRDLDEYLKGKPIPPCPRTYPNDPNTAEDPCEDCGRDERKHEIGPRAGHIRRAADCPNCSPCPCAETD
jgi:hypothetical protein